MVCFCKRTLLTLLFAVAGLSVSRSTGYAQMCKFTAATQGKPAKCVSASSTGKCSPVATGTGNTGTCKVVSGEECSCAGNPEPTPTPGGPPGGKSGGTPGGGTLGGGTPGGGSPGGVPLGGALQGGVPQGCVQSGVPGIGGTNCPPGGAPLGGPVGGVPPGGPVGGLPPGCAQVGVPNIAGTNPGGVPTNCPPGSVPIVAQTWLPPQLCLPAMCSGQSTIYLGREPSAAVDIWWTGAAGVTAVLPVRSGAKDGPYLLVPRDSIIGGGDGGANYVRIYNVKPGTTTYYKLVGIYPEGPPALAQGVLGSGAIVIDGKSKGTALSEALLVSVPPKPASPSVTADGRTLTWIGDPAVAQYQVERWSSQTGPNGGDVFQQRFDVPGVIGRMTFTDTDANPGIYRYDVISRYPDRRSGALLVNTYTDVQILACF